MRPEAATTCRSRSSRPPPRPGSCRTPSSTDMNVRTLGIPGFGQLTLGTYLLSVGVALPEVIERMTVRPAAVLGLDIGRAFEGSLMPRDDAASAGDRADAGVADPGDVTVIRVIDGPFEIADVDGRTRHCRTAARALGDRAGRPVRARPGPSNDGSPSRPCPRRESAACSPDASSSSPDPRAASVAPSRRRCSTPALASSSTAVIP